MSAEFRFLHQPVHLRLTHQNVAASVRGKHHIRSGTFPVQRKAVQRNPHRCGRAAVTLQHGVDAVGVELDGDVVLVGLSDPGVGQAPDRFATTPAGK